MIDAHQHLWRIGRNDCAWPPADLAAIHRDFEVADLLAVARPAGVQGSVLVQSQESDRDTDWLLDVAEAEPFILGVVGWTDLKAADAPARIAALAGRRKLRGLRPMLQDKPHDCILDPALRPAVAQMLAHGLVFDALVRPGHLPALARFAAAWPTLPVVLCHGGKPPIASGAIDAWAADLARLSRLPNVHCKLSGLLTEAGDRRDDEAIGAVVDQVVSAFGADRVLWGSDWPVVELAGAYPGWLQQALRLTRGLSVKDRDAVFGGTAARVYGLDLASACETATVLTANQKHAS